MFTILVRKKGVGGGNIVPNGYIWYNIAYVLAIGIHIGIVKKLS